MKLPEFLRARQRLMTATALGLVALVLPPAGTAVVARLLMAWNVFGWTYLALVWLMMVRADDARVEQLARVTDEKAMVVLSLVSASALMSVMAIFLELAHAAGVRGVARDVDLLITGATVVGAWLVVPTAFALHYAHMYYAPRAADDPPPLAFPEPRCHPDYWDFLYFSFTIAVAAQTADVSCTSRRMRKVVLAQALLSFLFNTSILALMVNIGAGLVFSSP